MDTSTIIIIIAVVLIVMFFSGRMRGGRGGTGDTPAFPGTRGPDRRDPAPGSGDNPAERIGDRIEDAGRSAKDAVDDDKPRGDRDDVVDDIARDRNAPEKKHL